MDVAAIQVSAGQQFQAAALCLGLLLLAGLWVQRGRLRALLQALASSRELALASEARFIAATEGGLDAFFIFAAVRDAHGELRDLRFDFINMAGERLLSRPREALLGKRLGELFVLSRQLEFMEICERVIRTGEPHSVELPVTVEEVDASWISHRIVKLGDGIALISRNITERKQAEQQLLEAHRVRSAIVDSAAFSIIAMDLLGTITSMNKAAVHMFWYEPDELVGKAGPTLLHDAVEINSRAERLGEELGRSIDPGFEVLVAKARLGLIDEQEWTCIRRDGTRLPVRLTVTAMRDPAGEICGFMSMAYDITEQKRAAEYVRHVAMHDVLTGLPNRALLKDRVEVAIEQCRRQRSQFAVAMIDLDNFKRVNDSLGHHIGDELLKVVASRLVGSVRASDTVARMGGDEFVMLMHGVHQPEDAAIVARKVVTAMAEPIRIGGHELHITPSIGISAYPMHGDNLTALMRSADTAMYLVKAEGRNGFKVYGEEMDQLASERLLIENDLRRALDQKSFSIAYQPVVSLVTGRIVGLEALLRWTRPDGRSVSPSSFIPIAEEAGLIVPIGQWVLQTALRDFAALPAPLRNSLRLAVNLSPRQFRQKNLFEMVCTALEQAGVAPAQLELEITEGMLMEDRRSAAQILQRLRDFGVRTAIDDFGTGYSSLGYLKELPIDRLKIDRTFIREIDTDADDAAITSAIIAMAHRLNIAVLAEGIETVEQMRFIRKLGCAEAQGFLFSRGIPIENLPALFESWRFPALDDADSKLTEAG